jgi:DNA repair protein RadC
MHEIAELSVVRLALVRERAGRYRAGGPKDAAAIARRFVGDAAQETILMLLLDTKLRVNAAHIAAMGTLEWCPVSPRAVFTAALQTVTSGWRGRCCGCPTAGPTRQTRRSSSP